MNRITKRIVIGVAIVFGLLLILAVAIPNFVPARACACGTNKADTIVNYLRELDAAKTLWTTGHQGATNLTWVELAAYVEDDTWDHPVTGETYLINKIGEPCSAIVPKKTDWIPANSEVRFDSGGKVQIRSLTPGSPWTEP